MAAPPGELLPGMKKKVLQYLANDACDCKTTATLCNKFPVLYYHQPYVEEMARMFTLERTVKKFSKNRIAAEAPPPSPPQDDGAAAEEEEALARAESEGKL